MIDKVHMAMLNSFNIIILDYDWEEIVDGKHPYFAHNIAKRFPNITELKKILNYFTEQEDYKRCAALQRYIQEKESM